MIFKIFNEKVLVLMGMVMMSILRIIVWIVLNSFVFFALGCSGGSSGGTVASTCVGCHNTVQDNQDGIPPTGRRAVSSEFPSGTTHAHLNGLTAINDDDCLICHDQANHEDGNIELIDADNGSLYSFKLVSDLTSDPDISTFCISCHDGDGAARLPEPLNPFGNGNIPQNVAAKFSGTLEWYEWFGDFCFASEGSLRYTNSHHDISDSDQSKSNSKIECLNCHSAHSVADTQPVIDPYDPQSPWLGAMNDFCLTCHDGGESQTTLILPFNVFVGSISVDANNIPCANPAADCTTSSSQVLSLSGIDSCSYNSSPWWNNYPNSHEVHGGGSKRNYTGYSAAPEADMDCLVCHDPHGSYSPTNPAGNPYMIKDIVDGTPFVDDGAREAGFNGPPWNTFGVNKEVVVAVTPGANPPPTGSDPYIIDWGGVSGLCVNCHADWMSSFSSSHGFCSSCQTCHSHGSDWENNDFVGNQDVSCGSCGNNIIDGPVEECDDGNKVGGDGCSDTCQNE